MRAPYLFRGRLILEEAASRISHRSRRLVLVAILGHRFHVINGRAQQFVFQQTRIGHAVTAHRRRFADLALFRVRRRLAGAVQRETRLPVVVGTVVEHMRERWIKVGIYEYIHPRIYFTTLIIMSTHKRLGFHCNS